MNEVLRLSLRAVVKIFPGTLPYLSHRTRYKLSDPVEYKTYEFFLSAVQGLVSGVYNGFIGGEFIDTMANLISGQMARAFEQAWFEDGHLGALPPYLASALEEMILRQYDYVDQYYRDIVDARIDENPIEPLLRRARLWANRWNEAYEMARHLITLENGGKEEWVMNPAKENCIICSSLNGIVAYAKEWDDLNVHPRNAPNPILAKEKGGCGGWECGCRRVPTEKRRSPRAFDTILNIVSR